MYLDFGPRQMGAKVWDSEEDQLDRIPDSLLLLIFNKLDDIKALGRCCAVSKRFSCLVPQVENVVVKVDCVISGEEGSLNGKGRGIFSHLVRFVLGSIVKPLQALQQFLGPKKAILEEVSHHSPGEVLRNFKEIKNLRIELPGGELGIEDGVLLKWKAEFGTTLESCVILGASSIVKKGVKSEQKRSCVENGDNLEIIDGGSEDDTNGNGNNISGNTNGSIPEPFYTNGGLKLRVVWTISSLIAASARHFLLQQIICDHPCLESLVLTDADGQGTLCMGRQQLDEFREKPLVASASSNRTQVPALNMKLWYAPHLELPGGMRMEGATLVAIRPSDRPMVKKDTDAFIAGAFEEPFRSAAKALAKGRTYLLEMNSF
ncbi:hypothetical protein SUGI_0725140 [Cryptomeria japonica]|uniref:F-box protein At5g46170 n=1 Tax=Cryptomeria japonica TaxID=3369 RepID=UPI0024149995|nr:F-box protein At5g46170 [Cryptomeria japonica]GLJ36147.1 hypothetical protein SUGI_0725140 [Cryptomeria japonica]